MSTKATRVYETAGMGPCTPYFSGVPKYRFWVSAQSCGRSNVREADGTGCEISPAVTQQAGGR